MKRLFTLLALLAFLGAHPTSALGKRAPAPFADLARADIQVITSSGRHEFEVWIADNDQSRERGLMFIKSLPAGRGMLFLFERPRYAAFWMKNTYLSLDLVFISADGRVVKIANNAEPLSLDPIQSGAPVRAVLEVAAGTAARISLAAGDRVLHPAFGAASGAP